MNKRFRSAITGRWVSKWFAMVHPATTIGEAVLPAKLTGHWSEPWDGVAGTGVPKPVLDVQCQRCGEPIGWATTECPNCHLDLKEDDVAMPI